MKRGHRTGLTLIEVLLATAMLAMALSALAQLQSSGVRAALGAQLESRAVLICQAELDLALAESNAKRAGHAATLEPVTSDSSFSRRVIIEPTTTAGLHSVTVEVYRTGQAAERPLATITRLIAKDSTIGSVP